MLGGYWTQPCLAEASHYILVPIAGPRSAWARVANRLPENPCYQVLTERVGSNA
jgi:hypothetical protein